MLSGFEVGAVEGNPSSECRLFCSLEREPSGDLVVGGSSWSFTTYSSFTCDIICFKLEGILFGFFLTLSGEAGIEVKLLLEVRLAFC